MRRSARVIWGIALLAGCLCGRAGAESADSSERFCPRPAIQDVDGLILRSFIAPKDSIPIYCTRAEEILLSSAHDHIPNTHCLARLALVNGRLAEFEGNSAKIERVRRMESYCDSALACDSTNALAHVLLGVLNYRLCRLSWLERILAETFVGQVPEGSLETSESHLRKAIALHEGCAYYYYALGRTLIAMDRDAEAVDVLRAALVPEPETVLDVRYRQRAERELADLEARRQAEEWPWGGPEDF